MITHIDYRESNLIDLIKDVFEKIDVTSLEISDIVLEYENYTVMIERKEVFDYINSIKTGHLWDQLGRMYAVTSMYHKPVKRKIVLVHNFTSLEEDYMGLSWASLTGSFLEIRYIYNIDLFILGSYKVLVEFLRILNQREESGKHDQAPVQKWEHKLRKDMSSEDWKLYILSSLPYVGEITARKMLERFKTIENVAGASIIDLMKVEKIGKEKAKNIYHILH